jgi:tRNA A22 N-methylase
LKDTLADGLGSIDQNGIHYRLIAGMGQGSVQRRLNKTKAQ